MSIEEKIYFKKYEFNSYRFGLVFLSLSVRGPHAHTLNTHVFDAGGFFLLFFWAVKLVFKK